MEVKRLIYEVLIYFISFCDSAPFQLGKLTFFIRFLTLKYILMAAKVPN